MNAFTYMFDRTHCLTPFAIERRKFYLHGGTMFIAMVYIFGIRVAYFNLMP